MKKIITLHVCILLVTLSPLTLLAQSVSINTDGSFPDFSALLDVKSTTKGMLVPRMTSVQRTAITTPAPGLLVFDLDTHSFWYYGGTAWMNMASGWGLTGNSGTDAATQFIGTTDNTPFAIRVNGLLSARIDPINSNTSLGYAALYENADNNSNTTAIGFKSLYHNTSGTSNTAVGAQAMYFNTTGTWNVAVGNYALAANETGSRNTAIGTIAAYTNSTGNDNTGVGYRALLNNYAGSLNTAIGAGALLNNIADANTATGKDAMVSNTTGIDNTAMGVSAMGYNTIGSSNTAIGYYALLNNTGGIHNTAVGASVLGANTSGNYNIAMGSNAMYSNTTGSYNVALGLQSLLSNVTGSFNTSVGAGANVAADGVSNATAIGYGAVVNSSNKVRIGNSAVAVIEGQVPFTSPSDGRFKYNVKEDVSGLDFILQLRPVTYQFDVKKFDAQLRKNKTDAKEDSMMQAAYITASAIRRTGFIAQEVEQAANKAGYNFSGIVKPQSADDHYSLSYESFVVPLVKAVQEQEKIIVKLRNDYNDLLKRIEALEKK